MRGPWCKRAKQRRGLPIGKEWCGKKWRNENQRRRAGPNNFNGLEKVPNPAGSTNPQVGSCPDAHASASPPR